MAKEQSKERSAWFKETGVWITPSSEAFELTKKPDLANQLKKHMVELDKKARTLEGRPSLKEEKKIKELFAEFAGNVSNIARSAHGVVDLRAAAYIHHLDVDYGAKNTLAVIRLMCITFRDVYFNAGHNDKYDVAFELKCLRATEFMSFETCNHNEKLCTMTPSIDKLLESEYRDYPHVIFLMHPAEKKEEVLKERAEITKYFGENMEHLVEGRRGPVIINVFYTEPVEKKEENEKDSTAGN